MTNRSHPTFEAGTPHIEARLKPCSNCGKKYYPLRKGRCQRCYQYWRNHDEERPESLLKCSCGKCDTCHARENAFRRNHGVIYTPISFGRFKESKLTLTNAPVTLSYLAGIVDGEGCITQQNKSWRVQIAMTDKMLIEWIGTFGGTVRKRKTTGNHLPIWRWLLMRQAEVAEFLYALLPYLKVKREQAIIALSDIEKREQIRFVKRA